jgi:putative component of toxin-antitoxin plasmid stabilization module
MANTIIPRETREYLEYCSSTGRFTWIKKVYRNTIVGSEAGTVAKNGYRYITFRGQKILAHRLAWFFHHGEQPPTQIDHINRKRLDNRVSNLRSASSSLNNHNRTGVKGVRKHLASGWQAYIQKDGRTTILYTGPSYVQAQLARQRAVIELRRHWV